ncbi:MAG TPA: hypothetical protein VJ801_03320 [Polyangia bacterium]|jgi:hypothetical protein|nr:hypothetical protein [Polyangia bacterium]
MRAGLLLFAAAIICCGQTTAVLFSGSGVPEATFPRSGDMTGAGVYSVSQYDAGRWLLIETLVPLPRRMNRFTLSDWRVRPNAVFALAVIAAADGAAPSATFPQSEDMTGAGVYSVGEYDAGRYRPAVNAVGQYAAGQWRHLTTVWLGIFSGSPLPPPHADGANNPLVFR